MQLDIMQHSYQVIKWLVFHVNAWMTTCESLAYLLTILKVEHASSTSNPKTLIAYVICDAIIMS
jgi:hypothetical protein